MGLASDKKLAPDGTQQKSKDSAGNSLERKRSEYWTTVMEKNGSALQPLEQTNINSSRQTPLRNAQSSESRGNIAASQSRTHASEPKFVRIAPRGTVSHSDREQEGYHFTCKHEGCNQRYKHQSSACRHYKNAHKKTQN